MALKLWLGSKGVSGASRGGGLLHVLWAGGGFGYSFLLLICGPVYREPRIYCVPIPIYPCVVQHVVSSTGTCAYLGERKHWSVVFRVWFERGGRGLVQG